MTRAPLDQLASRIREARQALEEALSTRCDVAGVRTVLQDCVRKLGAAEDQVLAKMEEGR